MTAAKRVLDLHVMDDRRVTIAINLDADMLDGDVGRALSALFGC